MPNTRSTNTPSSPLSPDFYYIISSFLPLYTVFFEIIFKKSMYMPGACGNMNHEQRRKNMKYKCIVDFAHCATLGEFFEYLHKFGSPEVVEYIAEGPGGGNPCITLAFDSQSDIEAFLVEHYDEDGVNEFILSEIF
jgi:hypothetical protein